MKCPLKVRALAAVLAVLTPLVFPVLSHAGIWHFESTLSGLNEAPPNASPGTGTVNIFYDSVNHTNRVVVNFSGLFPLLASGDPSGVTAAHVHAATALPNAGTAGVATELPLFTGFPAGLGVLSGSYDHTFDLTQAASWNPAYVTAHGGTFAGAEAAFVQAMLDEKAYLNIHSRVVPGGEIRGFLHLAVPDATSTAGLLGLALAGLAAWRRSPRLRTVTLKR
jgi:hypothetical protein